MAALFLAASLPSCSADPLPSACRAPQQNTVTDLDFEPLYSAGNRLERWFTQEGCPVRRDVVMLRHGDAHCGFQSVRDIVMTWPPGSVPAEPGRGDVRTFIDDPKGVTRTGGRAALVDRVPDEAAFTGFGRAGAALWWVPTDETAIYLAYKDRVERWPAGRFGCP